LAVIVGSIQPIINPRTSNANNSIDKNTLKLRLVTNLVLAASVSLAKKNIPLAKETKIARNKHTISILKKPILIFKKPA